MATGATSRQATDHTALAACMAAGSVRYYAALVAHGRVVIDTAERRLPLRHSHRRYAIDSPQGRLALSVPVIGSTNAMPVALRDVIISEHDSWRDRHWGALFSAYGKTPYFDFLADDLHRLYLTPNEPQRLLDFNLAMHRLLVEFLDLPLETIVAGEDDGVSVPDDANVTDLRPLTAGKRRDRLPVNDVAYHQAWQHRHPFLPDLSLLDLACNCGREAIRVLIKMTATNLSNPSR